MLKFLIVLTVLLVLVCVTLFRRLMESWRNDDHARTQWRQEVASLTAELDFAFNALRTFTSAAQRAIHTIEDEVERATGHSPEASALDSLRRDVHERSREAFDCVTRATALEFERVGMSVPPLPLHIGHALTLAVDMDARARQADRYLHEVTRLCQLEGREASFMAETMGRVLRLHHGDSAAARAKLRSMIEAWERRDGGGRSLSEPELVESFAARGSPEGHTPASSSSGRSS